VKQVFINTIRNTKPDEKTIVLSVLILIILIVTLQIYFYIQQDVAPSYTDGQYISSLEYKSYIGNIGGSKFPQYPYPPLVHFIAIIFYKIFGISLISARMSVILFSIIFILSMYGIGKEFGNELSGLAVAALAASAPQVLIFSHMFFLDFPQTAMTALVFYLILKTNNYRETGYSYLLGVILGLALLTKWSTIFFIYFPVIWFIIPILYKNKKNILFMAIPTLIMSFFVWRIYSYFNLPRDTRFEKIWISSYILNILIPAVILLAASIFIQKKYIDKQDGSPVKINIINFTRVCITSIAIFSPWLYYDVKPILGKLFLDTVFFMRDTRWIAEFMLTFLKFSFNYAPILILTGLVFLFVFRENLFRNLVIPLNIIVIFITMLRFGYPYPRYILSFIIFMAVLGGWWVAKAGIAGKIATAIIVVLSIISIMGWIFFPQGGVLMETDTIWGGSEKETFDDEPEFEIMAVEPLTGQYPNRKIYDVNPILRELKKYCRGGGKEKNMMFLIDLSETVSYREFLEFLIVEFRHAGISLDSIEIGAYGKPFDERAWDSHRRRHMFYVNRFLVEEDRGMKANDPDDPMGEAKQTGDKKEHFGSIGAFLIKYKKDTPIDETISRLIELHEGSKYRVVSADLPGEIKLTLIVFDPPGNSM